jgi:hypothetical protein
MRRDASRTRHLEECQPANHEVGIVSPITPRQMRRAFSAWLEKRGIPERKFKMPQYVFKAKK